MTYLELTFAQKFALYLPDAASASDVQRDLDSLLETCPEPTSESDWEWEAECDAEEAWRVTVEWEAAERARRNDNLSTRGTLGAQECPWLSDNAFDGEAL